MAYRNLVLISIFVLAALITDVRAAGIEDAVEAMRSGDFAEAYCIMRPLADHGDADAQYNIGWMYLNGYGLRINDSLALDWWRLASEQGHVDASFSIGMLYSLGEGKVAKNLNLAIDYYLLAATHGQEDAASILKSMMMRNDKSVQAQMNFLVNKHGHLFGKKRFVEARKLNTRSGPSVKKKIVATLLQGQAVLELYQQGKWSQVAILDNAEIDQTVWVYNPLLKAEQ